MQYPPDQESNKKVHGVKRGKRGEHPSPNSPGYTLRRVGQSTNAVFDVVKSPCPAASWIQEISSRSQYRTSITASEYQGWRPLNPDPS